MITERTKAILLFTAYLSKEADKVSKPLSLSEWNKLARWLQSKEAYPEAFLSDSANTLLNSWNDQSISKQRLSALLERKTSLALALDKWTRAGVWIISRADKVYPKLLKDRLKGLAPNILFGIGDQNLMNQQYIGVVGSRNADEKQLKTSREIGIRVTKDQMGIVSGGAKGVDEAAMIGALEAGGPCVGFLADSLIKKSTSSTFRNYIIKNKLILLSPYNPEAGFNTGNAMGRNKLIYALAEASIVVISDIKGGTWEGAKENLKNNWTPLWVCNFLEKGNQEIVKIGGRWLPDVSVMNARSLSQSVNTENKDIDLFSTTIEKNKPILDTPNTKNVLVMDIANKETERISIRIKEMTNFEFFIFKWFECFDDKFVKKIEIAEKLEITTKQIELWLDKAVDNKLALKKKEKSVYSWSLQKEIIVTYD